MYIDPSKTITAPYSQANELVFEQSSGQQCVAMSLCPLIYNNKQGINSANHLVTIMNTCTGIGNQLYSSLSQLTRQNYPHFQIFSSTFYTIRYYAISLRVARVNACSH